MVLDKVSHECNPVNEILTLNLGVEYRRYTIEPVIRITTWILDLVGFCDIKEQHLFHISVASAFAAVKVRIDRGTVPAIHRWLTFPDGVSARV